LRNGCAFKLFFLYINNVCFGATGVKSFQEEHKMEVISLKKQSNDFLQDEGFLVLNQRSAQVALLPCIVVGAQRHEA